MVQINLTLPDMLFKSAEEYVKEFGFRNVQDLTAEALREKIFEEKDDDLTEQEVKIIEKFVKALDAGKIKLGTKKELLEALK